jgi:hypothetical protein
MIDVAFVAAKVPFSHLIHRGTFKCRGPLRLFDESHNILADLSPDSNCAFCSGVTYIKWEKEAECFVGNGARCSEANKL